MTRVVVLDGFAKRSFFPCVFLFDKTNNAWNNTIHYITLHYITI